VWTARRSPQYAISGDGLFVTWISCWSVLTVLEVPHATIQGYSPDLLVLLVASLLFAQRVRGKYTKCYLKSIICKILSQSTSKSGARHVGDFFCASLFRKDEAIVRAWVVQVCEATAGVLLHASQKILVDVPLIIWQPMSVFFCLLSVYERPDLSSTCVLQFNEEA
jgi:hypothetical protein